MAFELRGERVILRDWRDEDLDAWAAMNADPEVRRYFPDLLSAQESREAADRLRAHAEREGFTFWALEIPGVADFAGFVGLLRTSFEAHFTPCVEIGWRLASSCWGRGYATEAARLSLDHGFGTLGLEQIVALAVMDNRPSHAVMERIGMRRDPAADFDHPRLPAGHPLQRHLLYRIDRADWLATRRPAA
ncbi:GNAT family N-acetyltransferase [Chitinimonas koreensis]|uniref:GNAT family N-acetyltransferase n=1 Tax=Chitinimonas koreensis TaxID=356302 RepID=UPI0003FFCBBB|nr:GNAT family N-acetyltransferase [Chitinimonas koreensis]QNM94979.1 GNAT family N-acetyltransferase [Chitinimonas koreensis]